MFTSVEHKFKGDELVFMGGEHKFTARKHIIFRTENEKLKDNH